MLDWIPIGSYGRLKNISQDKLAVAGNDDQIILSNNSLSLTQKIPGA
jgi:hypothetical protein